MSDPLCLPESERIVLGSLSLDPRRLQEVQDILTDASFTEPRHVAVWRAMSKLGKNLELSSLRLELEGSLGDDGDEFLVALWQSVTTTAHLGTNIRLLERAERLRLLRREVRRLGADVDHVRLAIEGDAEGFIEDAIGSVKAAAMPRQDVAVISPGHVPAERAVEAWARPREMRGVGTGIGKLDDILCGIEVGNMTVIGARPMRGKTSMAIQLMLNMAEAGMRCLFVTMEMTEEQIMARAVANLANIELRKARMGDISAQEIDVARDIASHTIRGMPIRIATPRRRDVKHLRQIVRSEKGADAVFVDFLQLFTGESKDRFQQVGAASSECKGLAIEFDTRMIVLSQLAREAEKERPRLSHMRESGNIEQDAQQIVLLSFATEPDRMPDGNVPECQVVAHVAKNRDGMTGETVLSWDRACGRYESPRVSLSTVPDR